MTINNRFSGEQRLLLEILKRAINDYLGHYYTSSKDNNNKWVHDAAVWIFDEYNCYNEAFTFAWVCEGLDLSPGTVQKNIIKLDEALKKDPNHLSKRLTTISESEASFLDRYYGEATEDMFDIRIWC